MVLVFGFLLAISILNQIYYILRPLVSHSTPSFYFSLSIPHFNTFLRIFRHVYALMLRVVYGLCGMPVGLSVQFVHICPPPSTVLISPTESTLRSAHKCSMCFSTLFDGTVPYKCRILFSQQGVWCVHEYNPSHQHVIGLAHITSFSVYLSTSPIEVHCVYKYTVKFFQFF